MLTQEDYMNAELIKEILTEKKTLPSLRDEAWEKFEVETEKVNKLLRNIPTGNTTEINELIYAGTKITRIKIDVPLRNQNRNTRPGLEIRLEGQEKKL